MVFQNLALLGILLASLQSVLLHHLVIFPYSLGMFLVMVGLKRRKEYLLAQFSGGRYGMRMATQNSIMREERGESL